MNLDKNDIFTSHLLNPTCHEYAILIIVKKKLITKLMDKS